MLPTQNISPEEFRDTILHKDYGLSVYLVNDTSHNVRYILQKTKHYDLSLFLNVFVAEKEEIVCEEDDQSVVLARPKVPVPSTGSTWMNEEMYICHTEPDLYEVPSEVNLSKPFRGYCAAVSDKLTHFLMQQQSMI